MVMHICLLTLDSHPLTVGLVGNRIARYPYYDEKVAAMRFRVDRQNSAIQPQSLGSHGRDRKIGLVGWQLRDSDFYSGTSIEVVRQDWSDWTSLYVHARPIRLQQRRAAGLGAGAERQLHHRDRGRVRRGAGLHGPGLSPPCFGLLFTGVSAKAEAEHEDSTGYDVNEHV